MRDKRYFAPNLFSRIDARCMDMVRYWFIIVLTAQHRRFIMNEKIRQLKEIIDGTDNLVFFGGAGVSTESGIPDFRSTDGLYSMKYDYPPETIVSHTFFMRRNKEFYEFYKDKMMALDAKPNAAHYKLAEWEKQGKMFVRLLRRILMDFIRWQAAKMY